MWNWWDRLWDTVETLEGSARYMKFFYSWLLSRREPQNQNEYIEFLIKKIRHDGFVYRGFCDLMSREDGRHPSIISNWRLIRAGQLIYAGEQAKPTEEELEEKKAIAWLISRGIAEPTGKIDEENKQWYLLTEFGWNVKEKYKQLYPP